MASISPPQGEGTVAQTPQSTKEELRQGGIAWAGSLVGSKNPANLGYRYSHAHKRYKKANDDDEDPQIPSNLVVQFQDRDGTELSTRMDVPTGSSVDDLSALVGSLLTQNDDDNATSATNVPYTFYAKIRNAQHPDLVEDVEITSTIRDFLIRNPHISTEDILDVLYQPLAVFRVRPVTRCTDTLPGHTEAILHLSFSPNGTLLASGGGDTTVRFWNVSTNLPKFTPEKVHRNHVLCTAWSPTGARFASADKNGMLVLWNPQTGKPIGSPIKAASQYITSISWEPLHAAHGPESERFAISSKDATIKIYNARTRARLVTLSGHVDSVEQVKWGGQGLLYTASRDRTIKVWTAEGNDLGKLVRTLTGHGHRINTLALSTDYLLRTGPYNHKGQMFQSSNGTDKSNQNLQQAAVSKWKEAMGEQETERLVSGSDDFTLFLWHPKESKHALKRMTGHQQAVNHISFSPDGRYFCSASFDKKVKLWNGKTGEFLATLTGHVGAVYQTTWSPDSRYLVSASKDSTAKLWQIGTDGKAVFAKKAKETLPGHYDEVYALDWSPNGSAVATGSKDRTIKIWKH